MNLVQVISSGDMNFQNQDVITTFDMIRLIYNEDYDKFRMNYQKQPIDPELGMVIGAITRSPELIKQAVEAEQGGGEMNMCKALEALEQRGVEQGIASGKKELLKNLTVSTKKIQRKIANEYKR